MPARLSVTYVRRLKAALGTDGTLRVAVKQPGLTIGHPAKDLTVATRGLLCSSRTQCPGTTPQWRCLHICSGSKVPVFSLRGLLWEPSCLRSSLAITVHLGRGRGTLSFMLPKLRFCPVLCPTQNEENPGSRDG